MITVLKMTRSHYSKASLLHNYEVMCFSCAFVLLQHDSTFVWEKQTLCQQQKNQSFMEIHKIKTCIMFMPSAHGSKYWKDCIFSMLPDVDCFCAASNVLMGIISYHFIWTSPSEVDTKTNSILKRKKLFNRNICVI